jgi:hypothetical protein
MNAFAVLNHILHRDGHRHRLAVLGLRYPVSVGIIKRRSDTASVAGIVRASRFLYSHAATTFVAVEADSNVPPGKIAPGCGVKVTRCPTEKQL